MNKEIDIPFIDKDYKFTGWVSYFVFMHILPYILKPQTKESIQQFELPISLHIQNEVLEYDFETEKQRLKVKLDFLQDCKCRDIYSSKAYYCYERAFYEKTGGDKALLEAYTMRGIIEFIKSKAQYIMAVHSMIKYYIEICKKYELDKINKEPSFTNCFDFFSKFPQGYPYQTLAEKALQEGAWKEFKRSSHLIYGYVEALLQKGIIPQSPDKNAVVFINSNIADALVDFDENYKYLKMMLSYSMIAQDFLQKYQHSKSSRSIDLWLLPEKLRKQYKLKK